MEEWLIYIIKHSKFEHFETCLLFSNRPFDEAGIVDAAAGSCAIIPRHILKVTAGVVGHPVSELGE